MVSEVKVAIDRDTTGGTFTNHDIIRGNINLVVTTSLSLNYIQVKLEGISKSQVQVPREHLNPLPIQDSKKTKKKSKKEIRREREKKDKIIQDVHKVLYDTSVVFPPENVRKVLNAKEFTLTPGNYSYPFEFKIPMNSSCVKLQGLSNMLLFNSQTFDININNGNFNLSNLRGALLDGNGSSSGSPSSSDSYHITTQLPPSLSGMGDIANIRYFIKVTCKRSSILKPNLRSFDPFIFLPLDIDSQGRPINQNDNELREVYYRKELVFRNRNPEIVAVKIPVDQRKKELPSAPPLKGFFGKIFDSASPLPFISSNSPHILEKGRQSDVPFGFEIRFRHPAFLIPTKAPSFKLFLVSNQSPSKYSLAQYGRPDESNGLGVVYLQRLKMELLCTTTVSALEQEGSYKETHRSKFDKLIPICDNSYQNLIFDLKNSKRQKASSSTSSSSISQNTGYELEVPKKFYANCKLPDTVSPSFTTCNISRTYSLSVVGGFSCEKIIDFRNEEEVQRKVKYVELLCQNIKVLSGINIPQDHPPQKPKRPTPSPLEPLYTDPPPEFNDNKVPIVESPVESPVELDLPTYDEVLLESTVQDRSGGQPQRRRYQQHEQYYSSLDF